MKSTRLSSLDAFRGLTIAGMILVNNPGSWKYVYTPLSHAEWHGWTPTDLVFPFFLFIVGVSISFALSERIDRRAEPHRLYLKIIRRSFILFTLGIVLHLINWFDFQTLRIPGVLQRIALCYLFSTLIFLKADFKWRAVIALLILGGYWAVLKLVPVPGYGAGVLDYQGNLCGYIDTKLLSGHLYRPEFDPEGILSTLPAISTTLLGTLTGDWLRSSIKIPLKSLGLFGGGFVLAVSGLLIHPYFPINKPLWTSTYVLFTAGTGMILLGVFFSLIEGLQMRKWATPFLIFGTNAIAVYVGSTLMAILLSKIKISFLTGSFPLKAFIYKYLLAPWAGNLNGSLIFSLLYILIWLGIMYPIYRRKIFIKI